MSAIRGSIFGAAKRPYRSLTTRMSLSKSINGNGSNWVEFKSESFRKIPVSISIPKSK